MFLFYESLFIKQIISFQIFKSVIKAAAEGEKKLNKQICPANIQNEIVLMKQTWSKERPRLSWDFQPDSTSPLQSIFFYFFEINS